MGLLVLFILADVDRLLLDAEVTENGDSDEDEDTRSFAIELAFLSVGEAAAPCS